MLSLLASTLNEAIATALGWRAKFLERWLRNLLAAKNEGMEIAAANEAIEKIYGYPLLAPPVASLSIPVAQRSRLWA